MPDEWTDCKLADACSSIDYGLTASAANAEVGPRFLRITDIISGHIDWKSVPHVVANAETVAKYRLFDGDIVLARTGASTGASAFVKNPPLAVFASYLVRLRAKPEFDARYLSYYLKSEAFWSFIRGVLGDKSAQPNASASTMTQAPLCAPRNKEEQRAIAHVLGTLDDKVELNRCTSETLEAMASAVFKSWFVDFDPVRAKTEGRPVAMDQGIAAVFPDSFEASSLGKTPRGWDVGTLSDLLSLGREIIDPQDHPVEIFDHYSIPAFDEGRVPHVEIGEQIKSTKFLVPSGCVLLSKLNPRIPRVWFPAARRERRAICSTEFLVAVPRPGVPVELLYGLLTSTSFLEAFATLVTGTSGSHQRVRPEDLLGTATLLPPPETATRFADVVRPMLQSVDGHLLESQTLAALRDTLLPKLLSGEIRLEDTERVVGAAT